MTARMRMSPRPMPANEIAPEGRYAGLKHRAISGCPCRWTSWRHAQSSDFNRRVLGDGPGSPGHWQGRVEEFCEHRQKQVCAGQDAAIGRRPAHMRRERQHREPR